MRRAHIGVVLALVIGVVAAGYGQALGGGYLIRHASLVLTMDPNLGDGSLLGQLEDADVLIVDDEIAAVGVNLPKPSGTSVIDGRGMIVMPGFVDTHEHAMQSIIRGCAADDTVVGWLARCTSGIRAADPTESEMYAAARLHHGRPHRLRRHDRQRLAGAVPDPRCIVAMSAHSSIRRCVSRSPCSASPPTARTSQRPSTWSSKSSSIRTHWRRFRSPPLRTRSSRPTSPSRPSRPLARRQASRPLAREHRRPGGEPAPGTPE